MNRLCLMICFISFLVPIFAQETHKFEFQDRCGSPAAESQIYPNRFGNVVKIVDGDTIRIRDNHRKTWTVELAGADSSKNDAVARQFLAERILGKDVEFRGNSAKKKSNLIEAILYFGELEINRYLVENGISSYRDTDYAYAVSNYKLCVYDNLEEKAKAAKIGIWAK